MSKASRRFYKEGYSHKAAENSPHEGGPEFEARLLNGGWILGVS